MTEDEAIQRIIDAAHLAGWWWTTQVSDDTPVEKRISGTLHTFLAELDGCGGESPVDYVVLTCDEETGDPIDETRVSTMMHEYLYSDNAQYEMFRKVKPNA